MAGHLNWESADAWPDFYALLEVDPDADSEMLGRTINAAYAKSSALCDHRDLDTRFANQVLTERVLPQCRRILLDSTLRRAYDRQWKLHRDGEENAKSYHRFLDELEKGTSVDWPRGRIDIAETEFLPNVRSQAIEVAPEAEAKTVRHTEQARIPEVLEAEVIEANIIVPLVVPGTRASMEKSEKMKGHRTEIKGGVTFDRLQKRAQPQSSATGRGLALGVILGAVVVGGLGAAWAGGWLGGKNDAETAAPIIARPHKAAAPAIIAPTAAPAASEPEFNNVPPPQAGKPGTAPGKATIPLNSLIVNSDFEGGKMGAWKASNSHAYSEMPPGMPDPRSGDYVMTMWDSQPYAVTLEQTARDLRPGTYMLSAWIRRSGGQSVATMSVSDHGDQRREVTLPATLKWTQIFIRNIKVSSGQCKIEFSTAGGGYKWTQVDAVEFHISD